MSECCDATYMAWQRIFELARRKNTPLIITDIAGREPMVVLPLDVYERMVDAQLAKTFSPGSISVPVQSVPPDPQPTYVSHVDPHAVSHPSRSVRSEKIALEGIVDMPPSQDVGESPSHIASESVAETMNGEVESEEMLLEEKFYLEPIEEEQK